MIDSPKCPYCQRSAKFVPGSVVHPDKTAELNRNFWHCAPCDAYVSAKPLTNEPLGRLANAELRAAKREAHAAMDAVMGGRIRGNKRKAKRVKDKAFAWLAEQMGIPFAQSCIGLFDVELCNRAVEVCERDGFSFERD